LDNNFWALEFRVKGFRKNSIFWIFWIFFPTPPKKKRSKALQAFEMRKGVAAEAVGDGGWCNSEGKGRGGARRVYKDASYAALRARLGLP